EVGHNRSAPERGRADFPEARRELRCLNRELPSGNDGGMGTGLARTERGQSRPGHAEGVGLWANRPLSPTFRLRSYCPRVWRPVLSRWLPRRNASPSRHDAPWGLHVESLWRNRHYAGLTPPRENWPRTGDRHRDLRGCLSPFG